MQDGQEFFKLAIQDKVIIVPGEFFDADPGRRRLGRPSRFRHHAGFSSGPSMDVIASL